MDVRDAIFTIGIILLAGLVAIPLAQRLRLPHMLLMLAFGAILGPSVADVIDVPLDSVGAEVLLTLGVSFVLFHGGLQLSAGVLGQAAVGLGLLVLPGVIVTAVLCGVVASAVFDVPMTMGLLIGAALAPTDPAILIPLFERMRIRPKVSQTLVAESALNDPVGAVLALTFLGLVVTGKGFTAQPVLDFASEFGISVALGIAFGVGLALAVSSRRAGVWGESAGIAVLALVSITFVSVQEAGAESGYLGPFIAGLIVGNMDRLRLGMHTSHELEMRRLVESVSEIMVIFVWVVLGANLPFGAIADEWLPALAVLGTLLLVARPLVVLGCLLPDRRGRWTREEIIFLGWARETGVVPAALAGLVVSRGVDHGDLVVVTVALAIIVTLGLQASTKRWLAHRLRLIEAPAPIPVGAGAASASEGSPPPA
jgi:cell volume regulation protein A